MVIGKLSSQYMCHGTTLVVIHETVYTVLELFLTTMFLIPTIDRYPLTSVSLGGGEIALESEDMARSRRVFATETTSLNMYANCF